MTIFLDDKDRAECLRETDTETRRDFLEHEKSLCILGSLSGCCTGWYVVAAVGKPKNFYAILTTDAHGVFARFCVRHNGAGHYFRSFQAAVQYMAARVEKPRMKSRELEALNRAAREALRTT